jgi:hypothetical protein
MIAEAVVLLEALTTSSSVSVSVDGRRWRAARGGMGLSSSPRAPVPVPGLVLEVVLMCCWLRGLEEEGAMSSAVLVVLSREVTQWITIALKRTGWGGEG